MPTGAVRTGLIAPVGESHYIKTERHTNQLESPRWTQQPATGRLPLQAMDGRQYSQGGLNSEAQKNMPQIMPRWICQPIQVGWARQPNLT